MSLFEFLDPADREQFEENRAELIETASTTYGVDMVVYGGDSIRVTGALSDIVDFFRDYRSEIEEVV